MKRSKGECLLGDVIQHVQLVCRKFRETPILSLHFEDMKTTVCQTPKQQFFQFLKNYKDVEHLHLPSFMKLEDLTLKKELKNLKKVAYFCYGNFLFRFKEMVEKLKKNNKIENVIFEYKPPAKKSDIQKAKKMWGADLPDGVEEFYSETNGITLHWKYGKAESMYDGEGNVEFVPILDVFNKWKLKGMIWFDGIPDSAELPLSKIRPFNNFIAEACDVFVEGSDKVHYHYCGEDLQKTKLDFYQYFELVLLARGYYYMLVNGPNHTMIDKLKLYFDLSKEELQRFEKRNIF